MLFEVTNEINTCIGKLCDHYSIEVMLTFLSSLVQANVVMITYSIANNVKVVIMINLSLYTSEP